MNNDIFNEIMVRKDITLGRWLFDILLIFTSVFFTGLSLIYLGFFSVIPVLAIVILVPRLVAGRYVEFEYVLTNDQLDFDRIKGRKWRKQLYTLNVKNIEVMAPMTVDFKDTFFKVKYNKTVDMASNSRAPGRWFVVFNDHKDGKVCIIFEPTVKMVRNIHRFAPRKVEGMEYLEEALANGEML
ncbi:MAG: hypothetical protein IKZ21_06545 [Clostridia bacterium]|nr:hypothetical protein [Clostridia bacterium]